MANVLTATDLDDWSGRRDAQAHLPTLVRRLVMATVAPSSIRVAAAEGVGSSGFDGVLEVVGGAPPFVPAGRSVWELGTGKSPDRKAGGDYKKRTEQSSEVERATTTFVFVTSRTWDGAKEWAQGKADSSDGWAGVVALDAQDLATWLETCPGVHGWLASEHLGRQPFGIMALRDWFSDWVERTEPAVPVELLLCGREAAAADLLSVLDGRPAEHLIASRSRDEAVAFVAAALLAAPVADTHDPSDPSTPPDPDGAGVPGDYAAQREALLERAIVVHDAAAWRRWITHEQPLILIPLFDDSTIDAAVRGGHHVVLPRVARPGDKALPSLDRDRAREVWERAGVGFPRADELARAARRSLTSLRRRIGRTGRFRQPAWADGTSANLLATLLLAGSWTDDVKGDRDVVVALAERETWHRVARDLALLKAGDDAPIVERQHRWEFVDIVDAWDALSPALTSDDLDIFHRQLLTVLTEDDPALHLSAEERRTLAFSPEGLPRRRSSPHLRRGMANTLALLGAVAGDRILPGGLTGQEHAATAVRALLRGADSARWMSLADLLPVLAEAAPGVFLDAVEQSLQVSESTIMALFEEEDDLLGLSRSSRHTGLLWALETLAFSVQHVSRVAVVLAQLAERDPGGQLGNRPAESLQSILHLVFPQGAVDQTTRLQVVDTVRRAAPAAAWRLLLSLVTSADRGLVLRGGPRFRDWPWEPPGPTYADIARTLSDLATRIAEDADGDGQRWTKAFTMVDKVPTAAREHLLGAADQAWTGLHVDAQRQVLASLDDRVNKHARFRDAAWALNDEELQRMQSFLDDHAVPGMQPADQQLFTWWPRRRGLDPDTEESREALAAARADAVRRALADGLDGLAGLAQRSELAVLVGETLAVITDDLDDDVLDLLGGDDPAMDRLAYGMARTRADADPQWLRRMVQSRPDQAALLLLTRELDQALLDLLDDVPEERRAEFWRRVQPWRIPTELIVTVSEQLLAHDRPFSAGAVLVHSTADGPFPVDFAARAMSAPLTGTDERLDALPSPEYVVGQLLDRLEQAGLAVDELARLEWFYLPVLRDHRTPVVLYRRLAIDPAFFAKVVAAVYKPDPAEPREGIAADEPGEDGDVSDSAGQPTAPHIAEAAWNLLREWRSPFPGSRDGTYPDTEQVQAWVSAARQALADSGRSRIASFVIGEALSGPAADPDGTWPSEPVRDVLEHEQDHRLEKSLAIGRMNQRGMTSRGPYDGGEQERTLAAKYRGWANKVRADWPRAGAVLDGLADTYEADARREDASADRDSDS